MHVKRMRELVCGAVTPVPIVKITGDNQRRTGGHHALNTLTQVFELAATAARSQCQMHTDTVQRLGPARYVHFGVQQSSAFKTVGRHVLILPAQNRKARKNRVAVLVTRLNGITAIRVIRPHHISEEFVLRFARPVAMTPCVRVVPPHHFLQKHHVRFQCAQLVSQRVNHHAPVKDRQPFVDVVGRDA